MQQNQSRTVLLLRWDSSVQRKAGHRCSADALRTWSEREYLHIRVLVSGTPHMAAMTAMMSAMPMAAHHAVIRVLHRGRAVRVLRKNQAPETKHKCEHQSYQQLLHDSVPLYEKKSEKQFASTPNPALSQ